MLDLNRLLAPAERAGLADVASDEAASDDVRTQRAAGAGVQGQGNDTTSELDLLNP